ncbi:MAG: SRPBCC family protein [Bacteroidota bacterium]
MKNALTAETHVTIHAPATKVWEAITTPEHIKKYLFGTTVMADWKVGGAISYKGEYDGKPYEDKGTIKTLEHNKTFASTYWSSMSGKEDKPENYNLVTYALEENGDITTVTLTQDNIATEDEKEHMIANWNHVLAELKNVAEAI